MGTHSRHRMHQNSLEAYAKLDHVRRRELVRKVYELASIPLTDREVLGILHRHGIARDKPVAFVQPTISHMTKDGMLVEVGKKKQDGRNVRQLRLNPELGVQLSIYDVEGVA